MLDSYETLSDREREVLHLVAAGLTNKETASRLSISNRKVEAYRARLMFKLDLRSHAGLVRYAMRKENLRLRD